jgi:hypothetical protein
VKSLVVEYITMERLYHATLFVLYQVTLLCGIALLPLALLTRRVGVRLPVDRAVLGIKEAYEMRRSTGN